MQVFSTSERQIVKVTTPPPLSNHRTESAQRKRERMRARIVEATTQVFARREDRTPVIEDVVREAKVSRGTFYTYFDALDDALRAASIEANQRMISESLPLYDCLAQPWQRAAVGFRIFLVRAWQEPRWAAFMTRLDAWSRNSLGANFMLSDLRRGQALGQFDIDDAATLTDFLMGASAGGIQGLRSGVADPHAYMDASVRATMRALGCEPVLRERAVDFSRAHLAEWTTGGRKVWTPL